MLLVGRTMKCSSTFLDMQPPKILTVPFCSLPSSSIPNYRITGVGSSSGCNSFWLWTGPCWHHPNINTNSPALLQQILQRKKHLPSLAKRTAPAAGLARKEPSTGSQACQRHDKNMMYFSPRNLIISSCEEHSRRETVLESLWSMLIQFINWC